MQSSTLSNFFDFPTIISVAVTIGSVIIAIYIHFASTKELRYLRQQNEGFKSDNEKLLRLLEKERQHFTWEEIQTACGKLALEIRKFDPDYIVSTPGIPMLVLSLIVESLYMWIPNYIIMVSSENIKNAPDVHDSENCLALGNYSHKWFVPKKLLEKNDCKVVIIDDVVFNTSYFEKLMEVFKNAGFERDQLLTVSVIASANLENSKTLDFAGYFVSNTKLYLPWGEEKK